MTDDTERWLTVWCVILLVAVWLWLICFIAARHRFLPGAQGASPARSLSSLASWRRTAA